MPETSSPLPPNWPEFLAEVHQRLQLSIAAVDGRLQEIPEIDIDDRVVERQQEVARLEACLHGLSAQLESAEKLGREVDQALESSEQTLRQQCDTSVSLREKLAAWAGRAIG